MTYDRNGNAIIGEGSGLHAEDVLDAQFSAFLAANGASEVADAQKDQIRFEILRKGSALRAAFEGFAKVGIYSEVA